MKLTMKRKGQFQCDWSTTDGKCGVGTDLRPMYYYQCHIETADILDKKGFIVDQLDIDKYFKQKYSGKVLSNKFVLQGVPAQSCEKIAINAVTDIKRMVEDHMLENNGMSVVYKIAVTVSFGEDATMTAEWVPEKAKEIANVKKIKRVDRNSPAYFAARERQMRAATMICASCQHFHQGKKKCSFPVWTTITKFNLAGNLPCQCTKNPNGWQYGILIRWRFWQSSWIGYHYSHRDLRLCINVLPWVTFWITKPGGNIP